MAELVLVDRLKAIESSAQMIQEISDQACIDVSQAIKSKDMLIDAAVKLLKKPISRYAEATGQPAPDFALLTQYEKDDELAEIDKAKREMAQIRVLPVQAELIKQYAGIREGQPYEQNDTLQKALYEGKLLENWIKEFDAEIRKGKAHKHQPLAEKEIGELSVLVNHTDYIGVRKFSMKGLMGGAAGAGAFGLFAAAVAAFGIDQASFESAAEYTDTVTTLILGSSGGAAAIGTFLGGYFMTPEMGWATEEAKYIDNKIVQCRDAGLL